MTEFAHEYASHDGAAAEFRIREGAASTPILHRADGTVHAVDSERPQAKAVEDWDWSEWAPSGRVCLHRPSTNVKSLLDSSTHEWYNCIVVGGGPTGPERSQR